MLASCRYCCCCCCCVLSNDNYDSVTKNLLVELNAFTFLLFCIDISINSKFTKLKTISKRGEKHCVNHLFPFKVFQFNRSIDKHLRNSNTHLSPVQRLHSHAFDSVTVLYARRREERQWQQQCKVHFTGQQERERKWPDIGPLNDKVQ